MLGGLSFSDFRLFCYSTRAKQAPQLNNTKFPFPFKMARIFSRRKQNYLVKLQSAVLDSVILTSFFIIFFQKVDPTITTMQMQILLSVQLNSTKLRPFGLDGATLLRILNCLQAYPKLELCSWVPLRVPCGCWVCIPIKSKNFII